MAQDNNSTPRVGGWVKATPGLAVGAGLASLVAALPLFLITPASWWLLLTMKVLGLTLILLGRVLAEAIVDVVVARDVDDAESTQPDAALIAFHVRWRLGKIAACGLGRHVPQEDGFCPRCGHGAPKHAPHEVQLADGTSLTVLAVNDASARTKVVYGDRADLSWPSHPNQLQFAHGGDAEPLAEVKVHPSKIVSVRKLEEARDAR